MKKLLFPHIVIAFLLIFTSAASLIYSFVRLGGQGMFSYVSFALSTYTLTVLCFRIPRIIEWCKRLKQENRHVKRYLSDTALRVNLSLYLSLAINTAYAVMQLVLGIYHHTVWYYALAMYYCLLVSMRLYLLRYTRNHQKNQLHELKIARLCGILLLVTNSALSAIVFYIVVQGRTFRHHEITAIAMAAYTFTALTKAIVQVIRYRKYESPVYSTSKAISLAAALVSMLTLETTMLTVFAKEGQEQFRTLMTATTGAAVMIAIIMMAFFMILKTTKTIKEQTHGRI